MKISRRMLLRNSFSSFCFFKSLTVITVFLIGFITNNIYQSSTILEMASKLKHSGFGKFAAGENTTDVLNDNQLSYVKQLSSLHSASVTNIQFEEFVYYNKTITNIYFIKVHKTGSTTLQNIMYRFGYKHNLNFALFKCGNGMPFPNPAKEKYFMDNTHRDYNMVLDHALYQPQAFKTYMPPDTVVISLLRHPLLYLESSFGFQYLDRYFQLTEFHRPIEEFLKFPEEYDKHLRWIGDSWSCLPVRGPSYTKNAMAYHLGYEQQFNDKPESIIKFITTLENEVSLVLISEKYDESLILLRRMFLWNITDIMYLPLGSTKYHGRKDYHAYSRTKQESKHLIEMHKKWAPVDYALYEHFLNKLNYILSIQDQNFWNEVNHFKKILKEVKIFCMTMCSYNFQSFESSDSSYIHDTLLSYKLHFASNAFHRDFNITFLDCVSMTLGTVAYHDATAAFQLPKLCNAATKSKLDKSYCPTSQNNRVFSVFTKDVIVMKYFTNKGKCQKQILN